MGQRLCEKEIRPSLIVSSSATRAWTTAKIVADKINYPKEFLQRDDRLYLASVESIIDVIGDQDTKFNNIMIVGHNPGMTQFANILVPNLTSNLPTCGIVSVVLDMDDWILRKRPDATLALFDYPKRSAE